MVRGQRERIIERGENPEPKALHSEAAYQPIGN